MRSGIKLTFLFLLLSSITFAQSGEAMGPNTANNWNFEVSRGVGFSSGNPSIMPGATLSDGGATISDTLGNLLFYVTQSTVYNKNHVMMENGDLLIIGKSYNTQTALILPMPGSATKYYVFTIGNHIEPVGLLYHIIDMAANNGLGSVIEKNVSIEAAVWAQGKLTSFRHRNNIDFWILTKTIDDSYFTAFLVTPGGIDPTPVKSPGILLEPSENAYGEMKLSPDGKKLVYQYNYQSGVDFSGFFTLCDFNNNTGEITKNFTLHQQLSGIPVIDHNSPVALEFSPDSKFIYVAFRSFSGSIMDQIYQYETYSPDSSSFLQSAVKINSPGETLIDIQLAPDGRIYIKTHVNASYPYDTLDVIERPWIKGVGCEYLSNYFDLQAPKYPQVTEPFPNFIQEQLYRFVYNGSCAKAPFTFRHRFIPEPDSIVWNFGDGTTSTDFNPTHVFQAGGNYEVHAHVVYPDGRIEETSRKVEVLAAPEPWLGNDTLMCSNSSIQLDAGSGFTQYVWNGQFPPGNQFYTAVDTGYYSVRVRNDLNCYGSDTIHIGKHREVFFDDSNLQISHTTCGNSTGAIRGLQVSEGAAVEWHNSSGSLVGTEIDLTGMPVGNYILTITDTTGCIRELPAYAINNIDVNLIIENVESRNATCGDSNGSVTVYTNSSVSGDLLEYSISSGIWESNEGLFTNISPGSYFVTVRDADGCEAIYANNPVVITDTGGPEVTSTSFTPATGTGTNGTLTVTATGDSLVYILNTGIIQDTGYFTGLAAGIYSVLVNDKYGCDTTVVIVVTSETGFQLSALAGGDRKCLHKIATSVLKVSNLNGVKDFKTTVIFNNSLMDCMGYDQMFDPALTVTEFPDRIELQWHGSTPLSLTDTVTLAHLVFETTQTGTADVRWDLTTGSYFRDENGLDIPCIPIDGEVFISDPPVVVTNGDKRLCEGDMTVISGDAFLGTPPYNIEWTKPDGSITNASPIWLFSVGEADAGEYIVNVSDRYCTVSDTVKLEVVPAPDAHFPDSLYFENQYILEAPQGYASYQWSTGDTIYYITVTEEGEYSVIIKTDEGCTDTSSVVMSRLKLPELMVPNAFTPNGDGLNDTFKPIITNPDQIVHYHLSIYNRWGQCFFETSDYKKGWDAKNALPGVYVWVIRYENRLGKAYEMRGTVIIIK